MESGCNGAQLVALMIALAAVVLLAIEVGGPPFIALGLAFSFGFYGVVKKVVPVDPRVSVGLEAAIAAPFAIAYIVVLQLSGHGQFTNNGLGHIVLMILSGPITAIPLLFFAAAARTPAAGDPRAVDVSHPGHADDVGSGGRPRTDAAGPLARLRADLGGLAGVQR